ncbi:hypothetical protein M378DRAFT_167204 [Amanita muscaria Koide BX008]|uniref:Uncharacterized protein n=1 Tax=Amanita muscaria (strain Koide BX008) TaxID=946122 RepID=A0A0C2WXU3_AMAMK|nr:hypothetical protein M378DRAFT_167204 [Amanita muscaria Koide BX008]
MQSTIVWFLSLLLLLPSLVASRQYVPGNGDIVHYQEHHGGTNHGLVVGSEPGSLYVAPLTSNSPPPGARRPVVPHPGRVVETHPGHVVRTEYRDPLAATNLARHHVSNPPRVSTGGGPLRGSPNHPH